MKAMRAIRACLIAAVMATTLIGEAAAQPWPARTITLISGFGAGSGVDLLARDIAKAMSNELHQPVIVEDRPGANGNVAAAVTAKAAPDGYTFLLATPGIEFANKYSYDKLPYDAARDFVPMVLVSKAPMMIMVNPKFPGKTLADLIAYAKTHPDKVTVSSTGIGSQGHVTLEALNKLTGAGFVHVPYNNTGEQNLDLISGRIEAGINYVTTALGFVLDGKIRALAVTSKTRVPRLPDVPTLEEAGFPGFESVGWYVVVAPKGIAPAVVDKVNAIVNAYIRTDDGQKALDTLGMQAAGGTPDEAVAWVNGEDKRWGPIIKSVVRK